MSKKLVAYFSATGVTAKAAGLLANAAGADLFEIEPETAYTGADLDWRDKGSRSSVEMSDESSRPAIKGHVDGMADYDVIYLGFPIWWYREPSIIDTFLEEYDFSDKTIVLFATSGSSGFGKTAGRVRGKVSPTAKIIEGKVTHGTPSKKDVGEIVL